MFPCALHLCDPTLFLHDQFSGRGGKSVSRASLFFGIFSVTVCRNASSCSLKQWICDSGSWPELD